MYDIISNKRQFAILANECINSLHTGRQYNFLFEEVTRPKTLKQLGLIFGGLVASLQSFYYDSWGEKYDKNIIKEMLYNEVGINQTVMLPNGKEITYRKSLSKMAKEEAREFISNCIVWIDENTECILPIGLRYLWTAYITDEEIEELLQQDFQEKDELYLRKLRKLHCLGCGRPANEAHHIRQGVYGKGIKNADYMAIPLCTSCHRQLHNLGEQAFIKGIQNITNGMSIEVFCKCLYQRIRNGYE